jgi:hypothetical protein
MTKVEFPLLTARAGVEFARKKTGAPLTLSRFTKIECAASRRSRSPRLAIGICSPKSRCFSTPTHSSSQLTRTKTRLRDLGCSPTHSQFQNYNSAQFGL